MMANNDMPAKSNIRGYPIIFKDGWKFEDNGKNIREETRNCLRCGRNPTMDDHDSCLGKLKNVKSACCGHGIKEKYVIYE